MRKKKANRKATTAANTESQRWEVELIAHIMDGQAALDVPICSVSDMGDSATRYRASGKRRDRLEIKTVNEPSLANRFTEVDLSAAQAIVSAERKSIGI